MFISKKDDALYPGKVAVCPSLRGQGRFEALLSKADEIARQQGLAVLEIESRIELIEVHAAFKKNGFRETVKGTHDGFDKPTFIVMCKELP